MNGSAVIGCALPIVAPNSVLNLTGTVIVNGMVYQGVTLSTLPAYFLTTNCASCSDLFTVTINNAYLGITYSIEYVLYSQYWFVINFTYSAPIVPKFSYTIQINPKYASYFTNTDMNQVVSKSVSPVSGASAVAFTAPTGGFYKSFNRLSPNFNPTSIPNPNPANPSPTPTTSVPSTSQNTLTVVDANGSQKQLTETTIVSLFG